MTAYYLIDETLTPWANPDPRAADKPFVAVLTPEEWKARETSFDMGIDFEPDVDTVFDTQAEANYDSVTGTVFIPDRANPDAPEARFAFALDEKGVVFIDAEGTASRLVEAVAQSKRWRKPCLARFLADFVAQIVKNDTKILYGYEYELDAMEDVVLEDATSQLAARTPFRINEIRGDLRDLDDHYVHLMDLLDELEENENGFFSEDDLRYFRVTFSRVDKLRDQTKSLRDQAVQIRDLYNTSLDVRQNRIMTVLTVVTAIFAPLTLITGWYGMNFVHMPELNWAWAYPAVLCVCLIVAIGCLAFFKHRKWL